MSALPQHLTLASASGWRAWLDENENTSDGVWLTLAKKGTAAPTTLSYAQALDEALCSGWIDGRRQAVDTTTFRQHFTPRRSRSLWSRRNVEHAARLIDEGRMRERGFSEIDRAKADGRWDRPYDGATTIAAPPDLVAALESSPTATSAFQALRSADRYPILLAIVTAPNATVRASRIAKEI